MDCAKAMKAVVSDRLPRLFKYIVDAQDANVFQLHRHWIGRDDLILIQNLLRLPVCKGNTRRRSGQELLLQTVFILRNKHMV